jgi:hypothetical protein
MHQTTVRFGQDLWRELEAEAARSGVSVAQYVRDAALTRLVNAASARGEGAASTGVPETEQESAIGLQAGTDAVWAQARLVRERSRLLRDDARATQAARRRRVPVDQ